MKAKLQIYLRKKEFLKKSHLLLHSGALKNVIISNDVSFMVSLVQTSVKMQNPTDMMLSMINVWYCKGIIVLTDI